MGYSTGRKPWSSDPYSESNDEERSARQKVFYFALVIILVFGVLTIQLARMQLVRGASYELNAETNSLREIPTQPTRGLIYDRNGVPLVENRASFNAAVVAADVPKERQTEISIALQELTGVPAGEIEDTITARRLSNDPFSPAVIKDNIPEEMAFRIRERLASLPGARVLTESVRAYDEPLLLSHILGFVGPIDEDEYDALQDKGYQLSDRIGKAGVELTYESILRGTSGIRDVETDASGRELRVLSEKAAKPGNSLVLSIDLDLQRKVTEFLQAAMGKSLNGAAMVMDVRTGDVLAMVSLPGYDNNIFTGEVDGDGLAKLLADPSKPLVNHAITEQYPPGSTFKQVTGLAALQEGVATPNTMIFSPGVIYVQNQYDPRIRYAFKDWRSDLGTMNFYRGVAMSSDVYFYYLAGGYSENGKDLFQGLGATKLAQWAKRFGLGEPSGIDIPGESDGIVPDPTWKEANIGEPWTIGDTYNFGIGQGYLTATPVQMLLVTAAVANGGNIMIPHVVKELRDANGETLQITRPTIKRNLNVDPRNFTALREGMRQAVADGSAFTAATKSVVVAGKTGTAEFGPQRADGSYLEHGWFTGFAPYDNPEIAVVIFLEQGNGQGTAAPVASKIFDYYFTRKNLAAVP